MNFLYKNSNATVNAMLYFIKIFMLFYFFALFVQFSFPIFFTHTHTHTHTFSNFLIIHLFKML